MSATPADGAQVFWTADRVAAALSSSTTTNAPVTTPAFRRVWTDTRTIEPGDLFVALVGEKFDAHDFLQRRGGEGRRAASSSRVPSGGEGLGIPAYVVARHARRARGARHLSPARVEQAGDRRRGHEREDEHEGIASRRAREHARGPRDERELQQPHRRAAHAAGDSRRGRHRRRRDGDEPTRRGAATARDRRAGRDGGDVDRRGASRRASEISTA